MNDLLLTIVIHALKEFEHIRLKNVTHVAPYDEQ